MTIEIANRFSGGKVVGNQYVVTRSDQGLSGIIFKAKATDETLARAECVAFIAAAEGK